MEGEIVSPFLILTRDFLPVSRCDFCCFELFQPTGPSCLEFVKKEIAFVFVGHVHVAAARKRSHQWCISLTPNNTKTIGRMTCLCFLRPIIIRSAPTLLVFVAVTVCFNQSRYRLLLLYLYLCSSLDLYSNRLFLSLSTC